MINFLQQRVFKRLFEEQDNTPKPLLEDFLLAQGEPLVFICGVVPRGQVAFFQKPGNEYLYLVPYHG
jgi:hypothetical protein